MKELFLNVINNGDYSLRDMLDKISESYIESKLTKEDKVELEELARANAKPQNDYSPVEERLEEVFKELNAFKEKVDAIGKQLVSNEGTEPSEPSEPSEEVVEEYPEYVQPMGAHDSYKTGDKVTFNGKKFISLIDGNNWSPSVYPAGWEEVKEVE